MSEVKVNKISPRSGTGVTLGDSGDTFTLPSGGTIAIASGATINNQGTAVNFGATGSASWVTTVKTSTFTAVAGEGYFVNTTAGAVTVNLPAGVAGAVVAIKDYAGTFDTNSVTLVQNGSDKIGGSTINGTLSVEGIAVTLVFIDSTQGWLVTDSGLQTEAPTAQYIVATGGSISTVCTNFKVHTFTGPGSFTVCSVGNAAGSTSVDYLVIGGGGGAGSGGNTGSGGGGAGGYRESPGTASGPYTVSPRGASPAAAVVVSAQGYPIVVGAGGAGQPYPTGGDNGSPSSGLSITSTGGGGNGTPGLPGGTGGSGGGAGRDTNNAGGAGNTPPTNPAQGFNGGAAGGGPPNGGSGGGGGATEVGEQGSAPGPAPNENGGDGGDGGTSSINGTPTARGGGGGGMSHYSPNTPGAGGAGGGGAGGREQTGTAAGAGTANTGGGAGGGGPSAKAGGSGIVIIRYKFQ